MNCAEKTRLVSDYCYIASQPPEIDYSVQDLTPEWRIFIANSIKLHKEKCLIKK